MSISLPNVSADVKVSNVFDTLVRSSRLMISRVMLDVSPFEAFALNLIDALFSFSASR